MLRVTSDWSTAEIYLHGAHVTSFQKKDEPPLLFTSQSSHFATGHPIRGGIPIIFPWFGARQGSPAHGFARLHDWTLQESSSLPDGGVAVRFSFPGCAASAPWPSFTADYIVTVADTLRLEFIVTNVSRDMNLACETCLHTYFAVGNIETISVSGLKGTSYSDKVENFVRKLEMDEVIRFTGEVDRVYTDTTAPVDILDPTLGRRIRVEKSGSASTVVWNPWVARARQLPDLGDNDYREMVCVESGNVGPNKLSLRPGNSSSLRVQLSTSALKSH